MQPAAATPGSRDSAGVYDGLVVVLRRYLSRESVEATLTTVLTKRGLTPDRLDSGNLPEVVAEAMIGLRLFCAPDRIGDLMLDLADYCETRGA